jgi:L-asparaginase
MAGRIYVAYTGGTVGMRRTEHGFAPDPGYLEALLGQIPQFSAPDVPRFTLRQYDPLLDSANMTPWDWRRIAEDLKAHDDDHDGFLILHGTDTMAYTAAALSFMLEDLSKPVVLTGSQIPLCETRNDAQENLLTALVFLGRYGHRVAEVLVLFGGHLLPELGHVGIDFDLRWDLIRQPRERRALSVRPIGAARVASLRLFPGMQSAHFEALLGGVQGLVLECYGAGNAPHRNEAFMSALRAAHDAGVVLVALPQPLRGSADLSLYATGQALLDAGVVSGFDMTPEAALTKLSYLFEVTSDPGEVRRWMQTDLRGELTPPEPSAG